MGVALSVRVPSGLLLSTGAVLCWGHKKGPPITRTTHVEGSDVLVSV